ncbi:MAG: sensor histidine kinase [Vicinamibacterales bacterium]|nr:sensor histidine kinase [Vicinamibacterales bacterium]
MRLSHRFALTGTAAALVPLLVFGGFAVQALRSGMRETVGRGMAEVTVRTAAQMDEWLSRTASILVALGAELEGTGLTPWQQERALRNYLLAFPEFRSLTLFSPAGAPLVSTRLSPAGLSPPAGLEPPARGVAFSPVDIDDDALPIVHVVTAVRTETGEVNRLVASISLEEMWRVVDTLHAGAAGHALLVDPRGRLLAHGAPAERARIARGESLQRHPVLDGTLTAGAYEEYESESGTEYLAAAARLSTTGWILALEQPTREAYAQASALQRVLLAAIAIAGLTMVGLGAWLGRSLLDPIGSLVHATSAVAGGALDTRVSLSHDDEFRQLAHSFNRMAERLGELQAESLRQERQATFGRLAAGLVHDLAHPVQNLVNSSRLLLRQPDDTEYREVFRRTMERESATMRRVLDDLRQLSRPAPVERFPLDVARQLRDTVEGMRAGAEAAGVRLACEGAPSAPVMGDHFALGRVWRNLLQNGIEASGPGGVVRVAVTPGAIETTVTVIDSGPGIPPEQMARLFDEFATTKRQGLGLGLAISKRIVEQLGGTIAVASAPGAGAIFDVRLQNAEAPLGNGATGPAAARGEGGRNGTGADAHGIADDAGGGPGPEPSRAG